ncbi:hypothetical protein BPT24_035 [Tenacibaculum phage pT24]|uniref:Uncharacterized protein n=1 Tax=Tenacibaculum phage pT24 TaxID=1880590 RepID=A0A1B4XWJ2_9CAUD|nr:hypothetical protein HYP10_gp035 [Tenacibaculum phage pT24]BAV39157.1 hypothetical protein BPT24_035 [Tenacibaculum phage pT24]
MKQTRLKEILTSHISGFLNENPNVDCCDIPDDVYIRAMIQAIDESKTGVVKESEIFSIENAQRQKIYDVVNTELDYIKNHEPKNDSHIVENFPLSSGMEAIRYNLDKANREWYNEHEPYKSAMNYIRKVGAICIKMGMKYGMPERK